MSEDLRSPFGVNAQDYDRGRPDWPPTVVDGVQGSAVLELGAGTGKLTRILVRRFDEVLALEPDARMRALLSANVPDAQVLAASAARVPLPDASVDAVFAANAAHFFGEPEFVEIRRLLRPGGSFMVVFYDSARVTPEVPSAAAGRVASLRRGIAANELIRARSWHDPLARAGFARASATTVDHAEAYPARRLVSYYTSRSDTAELAADVMAGHRAELSSELGTKAYTMTFPMTVERWRQGAAPC
jgi:SAM-dependent methyltransferase